MSGASWSPHAEEKFMKLLNVPTQVLHPIVQPWLNHMQPAPSHPFSFLLPPLGEGLAQLLPILRSRGVFMAP